MLRLRSSLRIDMSDERGWSRKEDGKGANEGDTIADYARTKHHADETLSHLSISSNLGLLRPLCCLPWTLRKSWHYIQQIFGSAMEYIFQPDPRPHSHHLPHRRALQHQSDTRELTTKLGPDVSITDCTI